MSFADVLIVVPCLNEAEHLPRLLPMLLADSPGALIVVADGGSTDGSRALVAAQAGLNADVALLDNPARLQSAGINQAVLRHGTGRTWLVRVDAHCGYPRGYVGLLLARARRGDVASVVVPMRTRARDDACFQRAVAAAQNSVLGTGGSAHRHGGGTGRIVDHGHHALMAIDRFRAIGGYCEHLSHNEDFDFDQRLRDAGGTIWLEPSATIDYFPRGAPLPLFRQYFHYGRGRATTTARHRLRLKTRQWLPLLVVPAALGGVAGAIAAAAGMWAAAVVLAAPLLGWTSAALGTGLLLGLRARRGCEALSGVAAMIMHLAWALGFLSVRFGGARPVPKPGVLPMPDP